MARYTYLRVPKIDWALLQETLEMDSHSSGFTLELRGQVAEALYHVEELEGTPHVRIEVSGGVVQHTIHPKWVNVVVVDYDNLAVGEKGKRLQ